MILSDFRKRFITSFISTGIVICLVCFALHPWMQWVTVLAVATLASIAVWEYGQFVKVKGGQVVLSVLTGASALQVLSFFFAARYAAGFLPLLLFLISFLILSALHFKEKNGAIVDLAFSSFGLIYIAIPMGMLLGILYGNTGQDGRWWVAYLLVVTKITDIGAYFGGSLWGKRKLAPSISPAKTIEGAFVGLLCAVLASFAFYVISSSFGIMQFDLGMAHWLVLGLVLGSIGQFGDLLESLLKRDANKKDSNSLPGLGGALDLIDSLLFNSCIVYLYLNYSLSL